MANWRYPLTTTLRGLGLGGLAVASSVAAMVIDPVDPAFGVAIAEFVRTDHLAAARIARISVNAGGRVLVLVVQGAEASCATATVVAYDAQGRPDLAFGSQGRAMAADLGLPPCVSAAGIDLATTATGALLLTASPADNASGQRLYRATPDGHRDTAFGADGSVPMPPGVSFDHASIAVRTDGRVAIGGTALVTESNGAPHLALAVVVLTGEGAVDAAYGDDGVAKAVPPNRPLFDGAAGGMAIAPDGSALVAGTIYEDNSGPRLYLDATVARFDAGGHLDRDYGTNGFATPLADASTYAQALVIANGATYLAGVQNRDVPFAFVVKLLPDGSKDLAFGSGGVAGTDRFVEGNGQPQIAADGQGRAWMTVDDVRGRARVVRFTAGGVPDAAFGLNGSAYVAADGYELAGVATLVRGADQRIYVGEGALPATEPLARTAVGVARLREDGGHRDDVTTGRALVYYHAVLDHYFMTANPAEQTLLDSGATAGWSRTGDAFAVVTSTPIGADLSPVCRFYGRPEAHLDSHFFSAAPDECAAVARLFATSWLLETPSAFAVHLPDRTSGACPRGSERVYRAFNGRADANHFYGTNAAAPAGWIYEGYGAGAPPTAFCAPLI